MFDIGAHDTTDPAPGALEVLQRFLNLHEHVPGEPGDRPPSHEMLRAYLVARGLLASDDPFSEADRAVALELYEALHAKVRENAGEALTEDQIGVIDRVAQAAGLHPHLGADGPVLVPQHGGTAGALGRLVAIAFLADLDRTWGHVKECSSPDCRSVFFDRSKNHSGKWCSMKSCGNRAKVRAWRERKASR